MFRPSNDETPDVQGKEVRGLGEGPQQVCGPCQAPSGYLGGLQGFAVSLNPIRLFFFFFFPLFRAAGAAYGGSQARGQIRAAGLHHSHSNTGSLNH